MSDDPAAGSLWRRDDLNSGSDGWVAGSRGPATWYALAGCAVATGVSVFVLASRSLYPVVVPPAFGDFVVTLKLAVLLLLLGGILTGISLPSGRSALPLVAFGGSATAVMVLILVVFTGGGTLWPLAMLLVASIAAVPSMTGVAAGAFVRCLVRRFMKPRR